MNRRELFSVILAVAAAPMAVIGLVKKRPMKLFFDYDTDVWEGRYDSGESITFDNVWEALEHFYPNHK
jgi:hypothetical protein